MSILMGVYPDLLKIVHKDGSTQDNNRPIYLLSIFDKIMEKLIEEQHTVP